MGATEPEHQAGELWIEYLRLDTIHRDPTNPKDHDLGALAESLKRFGFVAPMGMNEETGLLLFGHGRLDELEDLRLRGEPVPDNIKVDPADGMWMAPVIHGIHMTEAEGRAYVIADNRLVELGGWNEPLLAQRLVEITATSPAFALRGIGFDADDLDNLVRAVGGNQEWFDPGKLPGVPEVPGGDTGAYVVAVVFISFREEPTFQRGLMALTYGERKVQRESAKYAQIDGETYLDRWEAAAGITPDPTIPGAEDDDEDVRPSFLRAQA
jgi:hypothetical protein